MFLAQCHILWKAGILMKSAVAKAVSKPRKKPTVPQLTKILTEHQIRPSQQRLMILDYLMRHDLHPSAEMIFNALVNQVPTLSKAMVYNTLNAFAHAGLVKIIDIVENEARYDIITEVHGHFRCVACGSIFNFTVHEDALRTEELAAFEIIDQHVYFKGLCPACRNQSARGTSRQTAQLP